MTGEIGLSRPALDVSALGNLLLKPGASSFNVENKNDGSAHTFGSSDIFLELPQKWVKIWFFDIFDQRRGI